MLVRTLMLGAAVLMTAVPAAAQQRGTIEFGAFVGNNTFDGDYGMRDAIGGGGRLGAFLNSRWSLEFEGNGGSAARSAGLADRAFRFLDARVLFVPVTAGRTSLLLGGGAGHVDANGDDSFEGKSYGLHALVGGKLAITQNAALRLDLTQYFNGGVQHRSVKAGLSVYRNPSRRQTTVYRTAAAMPMAHRPDSLNAYEMRLRADAASYAALRDSLLRHPVPLVMPSSVTALSTMLEMIHFERDQSDLDDVSRTILRDKVAIFNANPNMRIVITGYASSPGTEAYNMALGFRRATAARAYLVSQGVNESRVEITTNGENNLLVAGPGEVANAANRRGQFRLLIADPYLVKR